MHVYTHLLRVAVALLLFCAWTAWADDDDSNDDGLDKSAVINYHGGVLVKNGQQTSCEVALISASAGFVAATCVVDSSGAVDMNTALELYTDDGRSGKPTNTPIMSSSIRVHPNFNKDTFANNLALVQFMLRGNRRWSVKVAVDPGTWDGMKLARRSMDDMNRERWARPTVTGNALPESRCASMSGLFDANKGDFICSSETAPSMAGSECGVPYGTLYGLVNGELGIAGVYSHSVITGDSVCDSDSPTHYYTLLSNYIAFAQHAMGTGVTLLSKNNVMVNSDKDYQMRSESFKSPDGTHIVAGNAFGPSDAWIPAAEDDEDQAQEPTAGDNGNDSDTDDDDDDDNGKANDNNSGNSDGNNGGNTDSNNGGNNGGNSDGNNGGNNGGNRDDDDDSGGNRDDDDDSRDQPSRPVFTSTDSDGKTRTMTDGDDEDVDDSPGTKGASTNGQPTQPGDTDNNKNAGGDASSSPAGDAAPGEESDDERSGGGLSGGKIAAIVVCILVFLALVAAGIFFGRQWYRKRQGEGEWSPAAVQQILDSHIAENEMGSARPANLVLPSYRNHQRTTFVDAGPPNHD
ncbi:hypothetical protein GGF46_003803 [Coemansia sp. RSA 552]|nr:hypothetical protein GGF46_003803 [Coemansia sp. RSA 552]